MRTYLASMLVATGSLGAQVPLDHLVVAARSPSNAMPGLQVVDPANGVLTTLRTTTGNVVQTGSRTVAFDPLNPQSVHSATSLSTTVSAVVTQLTLNGNTGALLNLPTNLGGAQPTRLRHATGFGLVVLGRSNLGDRLFLRDMTTGTVTPQPTQGLLPFGTDVAVLGGRVFASAEGSRTGATTGVIVEWDLVAGTDRVLGSAYPPLSSLAVFGGGLLAGDSAGTLHVVDPNTGNAAVFLATGLGRIAAIAVDSQQRIFLLVQNSTSTSIHALQALGQPLVTFNALLDDLQASPANVPTVFTFGTGCRGTNGQAPGITVTGMPGLGSTFTVGLQRAPTITGSFLVLGDSRALDGNGPLPRPLDLLGLTGCTQYTSVLTALFRPVNGGVASQAITVPNVGTLVGLQVPMQWLVLDAGANPFGATTSDGAEAFVR